MKKATYLVLGALLLSPVWMAAAQSDESAGQKMLTLRSFGVVGDGKTDDRAAIQTALEKANGALVDGEGLTYAVHGNIEVRTDLNLQNATFVQTMKPVGTSQYIPSAKGVGTLNIDPPDALVGMVKGLPQMKPDFIGIYSDDPVLGKDDLAVVLPTISLRTLSIQGQEEKPVSVRIEKIKINRGEYPQTGGRNDGGGLMLKYASPVNIRDLEVTGDGKGVGVRVSNCSKVRIDNMNIHDMNWAPYDGDNVFDLLSAASVRDDFGWNNFPIYEFRTNLNRFVRVRIQEQLVGIFVSYTEDIEIINSTIARLQTKIGDTLYPLQCDGMTVNRMKGFTAKNCDISKVWEGIDFTGAAGQDFYVEKTTVSDTLGWAFKIAHPKQNGKFVDCTAVRAGLAGYIIGAESENIELLNCKALETGANKYWVKEDGSEVMTLNGILIQAEKDLPTPLHIKIDHCTVINKEYPGAIAYGIRCEPDPAAHDITLTDFSAVGAKDGETMGISSTK